MDEHIGPRRMALMNIQLERQAAIRAFALNSAWYAKMAKKYPENRQENVQDSIASAQGAAAHIAQFINEQMV